MANEITIQMSLTARRGNLNHRPPPRTFKADLNYSVGPSPGSILITTEGIDLSFSELTQPGWCMITNLEDDGGSQLQLGMYDPQTDRYYPMWKIRPGHSHLGELDELLGWEEYPASALGTGTGTGGSTNRLRLRAKSHACYALVECFEGLGT